MDKEELRPIVLELMQELAMSSLNCPFHTHTQTDGGQLDASRALLGFFQVVTVVPTGTPINFSNQIQLFKDVSSPSNPIYSLYFYDTTTTTWLKVPFADLVGGSHITIAKTTNATTINYAP